MEIHDAVLIAAAFSMFNRYVDGWPRSHRRPVACDQMGQRMAREDASGLPDGRSSETTFTQCRISSSQTACRAWLPDRTSPLALVAGFVAVLPGWQTRRIHRVD
jgi:hypothetical protein